MGCLIDKVGSQIYCFDSKMVTFSSNKVSSGWLIIRVYVVLRRIVVGSTICTDVILRDAFNYTKPVDQPTTNIDSPGSRPFTVLHFQQSCFVFLVRLAVKRVIAQIVQIYSFGNVSIDTVSLNCHKQSVSVDTVSLNCHKQSVSIDTVSLNCHEQFVNIDTVSLNCHKQSFCVCKQQVAVIAILQLELVEVEVIHQQPRQIENVDICTNSGRFRTMIILCSERQEDRWRIY